MFTRNALKNCGFGIVFVAILVLVSSGRVFAHCDALDGPVVKEAQLALERGDVTPLLKWVTKEHEKDIRKAFAEALAVRTKGKDTRELADRFFVETLVRIHRAGEGAPYTGLKPSGSIAPVIVAADKAIDAGTVDELSAQLGIAIRDGIRKRFAEVADKKEHANDSVEAGREFVEAYVEYVHFVEGAHKMVAEEPAHDCGGKHEH